MLLLKPFVVLYTVILAVIAQESLISIRTPSLNQIVVPGQSVDIEYTVNAQSSSTLIPNYPPSMDLYLRWKKNQEPHLELKAITGLSTQSIASGTQPKTYHRRWKLPHCQFFKRYSPPEWSFTVEFEMRYSEDDARRISGPRQTTVVIPIQINTTLSDHHHHNGCYQ
ncbi:hypothetical protein A0J61_07687 [Choanephora cucurbitarum]|uniref:Uncharacterized protein n=1 Tax=Choanephora cucurbitarum TaxID=101091 RepID=A0A1C7N6N3_9FUNG|nr:hypothetical protein A0J61_07687 [Choanephora cucurbitarum]